MSDDNTSSPEGQEVTEKQEQAQEAPKVDVSALEAQVAKLQKDLDNARKSERFAKTTKEDLQKRVEELEAAKGEEANWKARYEQAESRLKEQALDAALTEAAKAAKGKDIKAILKLVDRDSIAFKDGVADARAVAEAMNKAKQEFSLLFDKVETPPAGRAAEGSVLSDFQKEIRAAKSHAEIMEVMKRHNKA